MLLRSNFSSFPHFLYIFLTSGVKLHIHLLNVIVQFIVFLTLSTLICRCTDISKYFSESLGIRDNESRLYSLRAIYSPLRVKLIWLYTGCKGRTYLGSAGSRINNSLFFFLFNSYNYAYIHSSHNIIIQFLAFRFGKISCK